MGNRTTWLLLILAGGLGAMLAAMPQLGLVDTSPIAVRPSAPAPAAQGGAGETVTPPPVELSEFTETVDRPLFTAGRRPPAETPLTPVVEQPVAAAATAPPALELTAVIIDGARRLALFRATGGSGSSQRAEEGSQVEGWTVSAVRADAVVLERDGARHELALRTYKPPPAALRPKPRARVPRARKTDNEADSEATQQPRPRRPLRGPRRRSTQRRKSG